MIAYHVGSRLPGGFLGVDVFFVLSGYLITTLILRERAARGRIDLARFWARRARRLLPAMLLLVTACALMTTHNVAVSEFQARRGDMLATVFYYANWHFIAESQSYFALFVGRSPLEHMWSLAIEEQFYVLWPLLLMGIGLLRAGARASLGFVIAGIVASAAWMFAIYEPTNPTRAYIGTDTRAHTLLIGALLAVLLFGRPSLLTGDPARRVATWTWPLVAACIGLALVMMNAEADFYYRGGALTFALIVAVGLWIIEAIPQSLPGRALSFAPVRWIGLISYGLYLWHWPMVQWVGVSTHVPDPRAKQVVEVALTFAMAIASFYLVERPIRSGRVPWLRMSVRRLAVVMPVATAAVVVVVLQTTSLGSDPITRQVADVGHRGCPGGSPEPVPTFVWCQRAYPVTPRDPTVAVIGDSTSIALDAGMQKLAHRRGWGYIAAGRNSCALLPLLFPNRPDAHVDAKSARGCARAIPRLLADVAKKRHPDVWIISDRWMLLTVRTPDGRVLAPGATGREALVAAALRELLKELTADGARAVVVVTPPQSPPLECEMKRPAPRICASPQFTTHDLATATARNSVNQATAGLKHSAAAVNVDDIVCPGNGTCPAVVDGVLTRYDRLHYTAGFSAKLVPQIVARAESAGISFTRR